MLGSTEIVSGLESAVLWDPKLYIPAEVFIQNINLHAKVF